MNKHIKNVALLVISSTFTLTGCSGFDTSTDDSSSSSEDVVKAKQERENYNSVDLTKLPQGVSLTGKNPKEIAIAVFPPPKEKPREGNFQRDVVVNTVAPKISLNNFVLKYS